MKALKGKVTRITGAGTPYGDRLDRAPRPSGRWRRGFGGFLRSTQQERSDLFDRFAKG